MRRRDFLWGGPALLATQANGHEAPIAAVARYERASGGHIGFYAENLRTRRKLSWRAGERFVMCSTFKASLAALVLSRVDRHRDSLEEMIAYGPADMQGWYAPVAQANLGKGALSVREMCAAAVQYSDNTCASLLLSRVGGPASVTAFWRGIGDDVSRLDDPEPYLNRTPLGGVKDTTTPTAMANTFKRLVFGQVLSDPSRHTFTGWLLGGKTGDNRLRSGLPASWTTGDKTGNNGKDAAGDIAVTWTSSNAPIVIAAYTRGGSPTAEQFATAFQGVGRFVAATLGGDERADQAPGTRKR
ncbi:MAG: class A beta-lactamase [Caulobacteraceae bacterium]